MAIEDEIFQSDNKMKTFMTQRPNNRTVTADRRKVSKVLLSLQPSKQVNDKKTIVSGASPVCRLTRGRKALKKNNNKNREKERECMTGESHVNSCVSKYQIS